MPKSKHRRKPKTGTQESTPSMEVSEAVESASTSGAAGRDEKPKKSKVSTVQFFRQVRDEAQKITWTSRSETLVSSIMVLIMVAIASIFFFMVDQVLRFVVPFILGLGG